MSEKYLVRLTLDYLHPMGGAGLDLMAIAKEVYLTERPRNKREFLLLDGYTMIVTDCDISDKSPTVLHCRLVDQRTVGRTQSVIYSQQEQNKNMWQQWQALGWLHVGGVANG